MSLITPDIERLEALHELEREVYPQENYKKLKDDISKNGVQNPLHGIQEGKTILIYDGIHRLRALKEANKERKSNGEDPFGVQVFVHDFSRQQAIVKGYKANDLQADVNPVDRARFIKTLQKGGMNSREIAEELGMSRSFVKQMWMLLRLDEKILRRVKEGKIDYSIALELFRIKDENERIVACEEIIREGLSRREAVNRLTDILNRNGERSSGNGYSANLPLTTFCEVCGEKDSAMGIQGLSRYAFLVLEI